MKRTRKIFALLLSICMIVTMLPTLALATDLGDVGNEVKIKGQEVLKATLESHKIEKANATEATLQTSNVINLKLTYAQAISDGTNQFGGSDVANAKAVIVPDLDYGIVNLEEKFNANSQSNELKSNGKIDVKDSSKGGTVWVLIADDSTAVGSTSNFYVVKVVVAPGNSGADISDLKLVDKSEPVKEIDVPITYTSGSTVEGAPTGLDSSVIPYGSEIDKIKVTVPEAASVSYEVNTSKSSFTPAAAKDVEDEEDTTKDTFTIDITNITKKDTEGDSPKYLFIKVVSEDQNKTTYYKVTFHFGDPSIAASIKKLTINNYDPSKEVSMGSGSELDQTKFDASFAGELTSKLATIPYVKPNDNAELSVTVDKGAKLYFTLNDNTAWTDFKSPTKAEPTPSEDGDVYSLADEDAIQVSNDPAKPTTVYLKVVSEDAQAKDSANASASEKVPVLATYYKLALTMEEVQDAANIDAIKVDGCEATKDKQFGLGTAESPYRWTVVVPQDDTLTSSSIDITFNEDSSSVGSVNGKVGTLENINKTYIGQISLGTKGKDRTASGATLNSTSDTNFLCIRSTTQKGTAVYTAVKIVKSTLHIVDTDLVSTPTEGVKVNDTVKDSVEKAVSDTAFDVSDDPTKNNLDGALFEAIKEDTTFGLTLNQDFIDSKKTELQSKMAPGSEVSTVNFFAVPYLDIEVESTGYTSADDDTYKLDVTPKYYVIATTENDVDNANLVASEGKALNAIKITNEDQEISELKNVKVKIGLPEEFVTPTNNVYVDIEGEGFETIASEVGPQVPVTFPHFSQVTIKNEFAHEADIVDADEKTHEYDTFKEAVELVKNSETIELKKKGLTAEQLKATAPAITGESGEFTFKVQNASAGGVDNDLNNVVINAPVTEEGYTYSVKIVKTPTEENPTLLTVTVTKTKNNDAGEEDEPGSGEGGTNSNHKVTVEAATNGTVTANPKDEVAKDTVVTVTVTPDEGYELDVLTIKTDSGAVPKDTGENNTYTFKMPTADVTVSAAFKLIGTETEDTICKPYTDVDTSETSWYHDYVHYMIENGLMTGTAANTFAPYTNLNRAMVAQILYAKANKPEDFTASKTFSDVEKGEWYTNAVLWAAANGAVDGYTDGTFKPLQDVTRQELAVMLYGIEKEPTVTDGGELKAFTDAASVADWAQNAMLWAVQSDIMDGDNNKALKPLATATRAEAAVMLYQYFE